MKKRVTEFSFISVKLGVVVVDVGVVVTVVVVVEDMALETVSGTRISVIKSILN